LDKQLGEQTLINETILFLYSFVIITPFSDINVMTFRNRTLTYCNYAASIYKGSRIQLSCFLTISIDGVYCQQYVSM